MQAILYNSAALSVLITIVDAGIFKWIPDNDDRRWVPAARTANVAIANIRSPQPTSAPKADVYKLARRSTIGADTCGYISGASDGTSIDAVDAYTVVCSDSASPFCVQWVYASTYTDDYFAGYSAVGCGTAEGDVETVYYSVDDDDSGSTTTSPDTTTTTPSTTTSPSTTKPTPTTTPPPTPTHIPGPTPETNIGAIVGGVVGGIAVIALLTLGSIFISRKKRGNAVQHSPTPPGNPHAAQQHFAGSSPPPAYPPQPPMQQQYDHQQPYQHGGGDSGGYNPRSSMQKSPFVATQSVYDPMASPSSPVSRTLSPAQESRVSSYVPGVVSPQHTGTLGYHQQEQQQPQQGHSGNVHELNTGPMDRELRELA